MSFFGKCIKCAEVLEIESHRGYRQTDIRSRVHGEYTELFPEIYWCQKNKQTCAWWFALTRLIARCCGHVRGRHSVAITVVKRGVTVFLLMDLPGDIRD